MTKEQFIDEVARQAAVSTQQAEALTKAVLSSTPEAEPFGVGDSSTGSLSGPA
jgi:hypothetical protein